MQASIWQRVMKGMGFLSGEWEEPALSVQGRRGRFFTAWRHRRGAMWWEPLNLRLIVGHVALSLMSRGRTMHGG
jgi:hypothetical protein